MSVWDFAQWLPPVPSDCRISLGEGSTPLLRSRQIGPSLGVRQLYFKLESTNPTGSYKDRFAAVAVSAMKAAGKTLCVASSSGNSGAALAAYSAAAGITCEIAIVEPAPEGKLYQMLAYGAKLRRIRGFGIDPEITRRTCSRLEQIGRSPNASLQITAYRFSPLAMQGVQTIAYELAQQAQEQQLSLNHIFAPVGGGGLALAIARGFQQLRSTESHAPAPAIHAVQPCGNDTIASRLRAGETTGTPVPCTTAITGLQVPTLLDGDALMEACRSSGGTGHTVTDAAIWDVQRRLAAEEGIFCEPAGAVALSGALAAIDRGDVERDSAIVCLITGIGFKDMQSIERMVANQQCPTLDHAEL